MWLLWVLVAVGVAGGVAKEEACQREKGEELCSRGFLFTATALHEVRKDGEVEVLLSLEESLHPHVTFDLSIRRQGSKVLEEEDEEEEDNVFASEEVTLEVNELRRVVLVVTDLKWNIADLVVTAYPAGDFEIPPQIYRRQITKRVTSDVEVFLETNKKEYAPGHIVDYRALLVDRSVEKTPKFARLVEFKRPNRWEPSRLPWVEVPASGILRGNFSFRDHLSVKMEVTSNMTSSDVPTATAPPIYLYQRTERPQWMSVRLEGLNEIYFSQPRLKGRVTLASPEGRPLEGTCNVTIGVSSGSWAARKFTRELAWRNVAVGVAGGEFELDVVEELGAATGGAFWEEARAYAAMRLDAKCRDVQSGSVVGVEEEIRLYKSLVRVDLLSVETLQEGNSSHPQATVVLQFLVDRRDGGSVEEEEPKKGIHLKLLLSKKNLERLRPSATNFSLPIPPDGRVRLEFQVGATPPAPWNDRVRMEVGDATEEARLDAIVVDFEPTIRVTPVDPARLIRRGDVVPFRVHSCAPCGSVNAILSSSKAIVSSQRFSFAPQGEWGRLDEVIELTVPFNVTEGSLLLTVYGLYTNQGAQDETGGRASIKVNLVPSSGPQEVKIVDQVDVDMSTIVTFRLEGILADSVVSLQAAKMESFKESAKEGYESPLRCHQHEDPSNREISVRDDSPGAVDPNDVVIFGSLNVGDTFSHTRPSLVFLDVDHKTSTEDNGTFVVTRSFDRSTEFGTYVVSGATFNSKSGRTAFSNSPVLRVLPLPVALSVSAPPSVVLRGTVDVHGYVKNNLAAPFRGHVTLRALASSEGGSTEVQI